MNAFGTVIGNAYDRVRYTLFVDNFYGANKVLGDRYAFTWHQRLTDIVPITSETSPPSGDITVTSVDSGLSGVFDLLYLDNVDMYGGSLLGYKNIATGTEGWEDGYIEAEVDA